MRRLTLLMLTSCALAGCTVGPDYHRPDVAGVKAPWVGPIAPGQVDDHWWRTLRDPALDALVDAAVAHNLDIAEAEANLRQARANREVAASALAPQVTASVSAQKTQVSANGELPVNRLPGFSREFSLFDGGFDASWELDLWGAVRRSVQEARARGDQSAATLADTRLRVVAEVVRAWSDLRAAQARLASARADVALRSGIVDLTGQRLAAGEATQSDTDTAAQRLAAARAVVPGLQSQASAAAYTLALLTGRPPEATTDLLAAEGPLPSTPPIVAGAIRSEFLERRPDVRAAESDLAALTADVGVQTANLFPRFAIAGSVGQQSQSVSDLALAGSTRFSIGPSFSWPVFSAGKIRAQIRAAKAGADASAARYERTVLSALSDSETAINRYSAMLDALGRYSEQHQESHHLAGLAEERFQKGEDDKLALLEAQSAERTADQSEIAAQADAINAYISLEKSLGGGLN